MELKKDFVEKYEDYFDLKVFEKNIRKSVRVNSLKISVNEFKQLKLFDLERIPWCDEGFWTNEVNLGKFQEHEEGFYFVQGSVEMIPALVLNVKLHEHVLDMCASPGGKSSQMAAYMKNEGVLVCNDVNALKVNTLIKNLQRMGVKNNIVTQMKGWDVKGEFDKVLVDAPCSGTGVISKNPDVARMWNAKTGKRFSVDQKKLLKRALEVGKEVVYSTCSLEKEENEDVVEWALNNFDVKLGEVKINVKRGEILSDNKELKNCLRVWPSEKNVGFFVAKFLKGKINK